MNNALHDFDFFLIYGWINYTFTHFIFIHAPHVIYIVMTYYQTALTTWPNNIGKNVIK